MHRYQRPGHEGEPVPLNIGRRGVQEEEKRGDEDNTTPIYQKFDPLLHGGFAEATRRTGRGRARKGRREELVSMQFMRKYVHYAKTRIEPKLTGEATEHIVNAYGQMRQQNLTKTLPITARALETIIRLSTAHAKARLSRVVEVVDCKKALEIISFALYHDTNKDQQEPARNVIVIYRTDTFCIFIVM